MKVSALVTTYKSARFIEGCLEDLTSQTLFKSGQLEIIVVVSGSPENEEEIVKKYQVRFPAQIALVVTEREPMYAAWNRAIGVAKGEYLTNANTDDRHRGDALELLAGYLDSNPSLHLAYSNCYVSEKENETFEQNNKARTYFYPKYFAPNCALFYHFGPHPMWRREVHSVIGLFSTTLKAAGDYEFNLRFALKLRAQRVDGPPLGLYLAHAQAISFKDDTMSRETNALYAEYRKPETIEALYAMAGYQGSTLESRSKIFLDFGLRALHYFPPWFHGNPHAEVPLAHQYFTIAVGLNPSDEAAKNNVALCDALMGDRERAGKILSSLRHPDAQHNVRVLKNSPLQLEQLKVFPSPLIAPSEQELTFSGI